MASLASAGSLLEQIRHAGDSTLSKLTRLLTGHQGEWRRREEARRRWRLVRSKLCPGLASTIMLQELHSLVRLAVEKLGPQRYQEALQGPELEELKEGETTALAQDERWPLLLRIPVTTFGICMGLGSQTVLWKNLAQAHSMQWANIPVEISEGLWYFSAAVLFSLSLVYLLKAFLWTPYVRRESEHPVRTNFFFTPFIACLFLGIGLPPRFSHKPPYALFLVPMIPLTLLMIRRYGNWMTGSNERLSKVANPTSFLSIIPSFVGASLAVSCGWREPAVAFFAVGFTHWVVVFITLYQQLPSMTSLTDELHPVYFLFLAIPFQGSTTWRLIQGGVPDDFSKGLFWLGCFLYLILLSMARKFIGVKFSLAWWAYTFPMTAAGIASIGYANGVTTGFTQALAFALSIISSVAVVLILGMTILLTWQRKLFGNDVAIAITSGKAGARPQRKGLKDVLKRHTVINVLYEPESKNAAD
ncbi:S-type anion channel [Klebsormidium nitens]|uniref:S-type anion channel n=1 Tax=Klebsormidium nitens TaxID=105231 RepID=A0A1Y1HNT1_KLENI|nr:S-type anion channel [Klebsormidium nitens]|eukprot:GAQ78266.1 S-type anion channel [Klebsormidium nitens]